MGLMDKAAEALLTQGGIWAALFLFTFGVGAIVSVTLYKGLFSCMQDRVTDSKAMGEIIQANGIVMSAQTVESQARTRAAEAVALAQERVAMNQQSLQNSVTREFEALRSELRTELRSFRDELGRRSKESAG